MWACGRLIGVIHTTEECVRYDGQNEDGVEPGLDQRHPAGVAPVAPVSRPAVKHRAETSITTMGIVPAMTARVVPETPARKRVMNQAVAAPVVRRVARIVRDHRGISERGDAIARNPKGPASDHVENLAGAV